MSIPQNPKHWQDKLLHVRWDVIGEKQEKSARYAARKLAERNTDLGMGEDDYYQDALIYMASHPKEVESVQTGTQLTRWLVANLLRKVGEGEKVAKMMTTLEDENDRE